MMTFEQFNNQYQNQKKSIDNEQRGLKKKMKDLKVKKMKISLAQYNQKRDEIAKRMNKYTAGPSSF
jgi:hypothetical protein